MNLEVLVATMNQKDISKFQEMNLDSDVVFANQTDEYGYREETINDNTVRMVSTKTRGVGLNRNIALGLACDDILLLSDDDLVYVDDYKNIVLKAFEKVPQADALIFNLDYESKEPVGRHNTSIKKVCTINSLNYGAPRIAVRKKAINRAGITFNTNFGGGTIYSAGEDSIFICDMLKSGLKIYTYPATIAVLKESKSTWFSGYNRKYFFDKGAFYGCAFPWAFKLMCLQDLIRHRNMYKESGMALGDMYRLMRKGKTAFSSLKEYQEDIDL